MDPITAHTLYTALAGDEVSFIYSGAFHDEHTARLISLCEAHLVAKAAPRPVRQRLAFVLVEAYQNIIRHRPRLTGQLDRDVGRSMLLLRCDPLVQQVCAVNAITKSEVPGLEELLERLAGMDRGQLKEMFLDRLRSHGHGNRGGAGLGLIEMARRSGHELIYELGPLDKDHELFMLLVTMGDEDVAADGRVDAIRRLHDLVAENDILLLHLGSAGAAVQEALLRITERDVGYRPGRAVARSRAYLAAMEYLTEGKALKGNAMIVLARQNAHYLLTLAGWLDPRTAPATTRQMEELLKLTRTELQHTFRNALKARAAGERPVGLGLIDLANHASQPLTLARTSHDDGEFLVVQAVV